MEGGLNRMLCCSIAEFMEQIESVTISDSRTNISIRKKPCMGFFFFIKLARSVNGKIFTFLC